MPKLLIPLCFALSIATASPTQATALSPTKLVDRMLMAIESKNLGAVLADTSDDATLTLQFAPDSPLAISGKPAISRYFATFFGLYSTIAISDVRKTPAADGRTITVESKGHFRTSEGAEHAVGYVWVITTRGGKIVASRTYILGLPAGSGN